VVERTVISTWSTVGNRAGFLLHRLRGTLGGAGSKQGATIWGDRGEWTDVRPRRRKAFEQAGQISRGTEAQKRMGGSPATAV